MEPLELWHVIVIGVIIVAVALPVILIVVAVRLLDRAVLRKVREPIEGTLEVTAVSNPTQGELLPNLGDFVPSHEDLTVEGTASVPGMPPYRVRFRDAGWTNRWPRVGETIPIEVDRRDPSRARIRWDQLRAQG